MAWRFMSRGLRRTSEELRDPRWGEGFPKTPLLPHQTLVPPQEAPSFSWRKVTFLELRLPTPGQPAELTPPPHITGRQAGLASGPGSQAIAAADPSALNLWVSCSKPTSGWASWSSACFSKQESNKAVSKNLKLWPLMVEGHDGHTY